MLCCGQQGIVRCAGNETPFLRGGVSDQGLGLR